MRGKTKRPARVTKRAPATVKRAAPPAPAKTRRPAAIVPPIVPPVAPPIAPLLEASRQAHGRYRAASGRIGTKGTVVNTPDLLACGDAVREALMARTEAQALDPEHHDPAWGADAAAMKGKSAALVDFYVTYLARAATLVSVN